MPEKKTEETKLERRVMAIDDIELRVTDDDNPKITGYAAKFNKWSLDLGGFREKIQKGAFDEAIDNSDVRALKNHDPNLLLGRTSSGTLRLSTNARGLGFEVDMPDTTTGRDTITEIKRKDISGCSFSFTTAEDDWKYLEDGRVERTIIKVGELFDVGPVTYPAYPDTTVAARSMEKAKAEASELIKSEMTLADTAIIEELEDLESREEEPPAKTEEELKTELARKREIEIGYKQAGRILNRINSKLSND